MPNYSHFLNMVDDFGILQFSKQDLPDPYSGYTLDDNARGLLVSLSMGESAYFYALRFLNYLEKAQRPDGSWSNFYLAGKYYSHFDSEDSIGRALLACSAATCSDWPDLACQAGKILINQFPVVKTFTSPRAIAYALLGLCKGKMPCPDKFLHELINLLAAYLIGLYARTRSRDWMWFENYITYCNGILPHALFSVYAFNGDKKCLKIAHESLNFLVDNLFSQGYLNIVGNQGWYHRDGQLPRFDQQPVDAASIAFACWEAFQNLGKSDYIELAHLAHNWYRGRNLHGLSLYNEVSGGCHDALTEDGLNLNQGAEAVLSLLLTDILMTGSISRELPQVSWGQA